ncbi:autotransporter outer membrane beta-barrel domain-containing protein [Paraburkholderia sp. EG304]
MGDALQYSLGINGTYTQRLSLYGRVSYQQQIGSGGFRGWLINGGARYVF